MKPVKAKKVKIAFHTLGCKLNYAEGSQLAQDALKGGFDVAYGINQKADIYTLNTCSVTDNADKECLHLVRRIKRQYPQSAVVITGCYAQLQPELLKSIDGVDMVLGVSEKFQLLQHIEDFLATRKVPLWGCSIDEVVGFQSAVSSLSRTRSFLKVQDGCSYNCSFCTIPMARGSSRSDSIENIMKRIQELEGYGVQEVVLTGINLGDFHTAKSENFFDLLDTIENTRTTIKRFRISSIEPNLLSDDIIGLVANSEKIMPHFHIPLQSGSDNILGKMRRRYVSSYYADRISMVKRAIPDCGIGVDVIVGFPSESAGDFEDTVQLLEELPISYLHVFTYSERPHTKSLAIQPVVDASTRKERAKYLRDLSAKKAKDFHQSYLGTVRPILFERATESNATVMRGYTDNYIRIEAPYQKEVVNQVQDWQL